MTSYFYGTLTGRGDTCSRRSGTRRTGLLASLSGHRGCLRLYTFVQDGRDHFRLEKAAGRVPRSYPTFNNWVTVAEGLLETTQVDGEPDRQLEPDVVAEEVRPTPEQPNVYRNVGGGRYRSTPTVWNGHAWELVPEEVVADQRPAAVPARVHSTEQLDAAFSGAVQQNRRRQMLVTSEPPVQDVSVSSIGGRVQGVPRGRHHNTVIVDDIGDGAEAQTPSSPLARATLATDQAAGGVTTASPATLAEENADHRWWRSVPNVSVAAVAPDAVLIPTDDAPGRDGDCETCPDREDCGVDRTGEGGHDDD